MGRDLGTGDGRGERSDSAGAAARADRIAAAPRLAGRAAASLAFTTYQTGKLFLVGLQPNGRLALFERTFNRAMGLWASPETLYLGTLFQLWRFDNALEPGQVHEGYDRLYVPRVAWTTGDLDVHDIAVEAGGRAAESGIETPTADDLIRLDRKRQGKRLSNDEWTSPTDREAKIAKMKDGRTRLAYKPEHAVDLDTGAIVAAHIHPADQGDTTTLPATLEAAETNLAAVDAAPRPEDPAELVADKGYHSRNGLKDLEDGAWKSRIAERKVPGVSRWHGDEAAQRAVYNNRARLRSGVAKEAFKLRAELVERSFALTLDRGGMRRAWLRGCENLHKRYLVHVAGYNLGLVMRLLVGAGTPREFLAPASGHLLLLATADDAVTAILMVAAGSQIAALAVSFQPQPHRREQTSSTG